MILSPHNYPITISVDISVSIYSLSVATTVLCTIIIVSRIIKVWQIPGTKRKARAGVEIIVESAALYSVSALVYIPMIGPGNQKVGTYIQYADVFFATMAVCHFYLFIPRQRY
jgi:hypothetical protein